METITPDEQTISYFVKKILTAQVYPVAKETPLSFAPMLSNTFQQNIWIKREDLQPIFSFKIRGAYNRMMQLTPLERERGVITASAGNHAQGVALAAERLSVRAIIVMPSITPDIKVEAVRARGATVVLEGDNFNQSLQKALELAKTEQLVYISPFDDEDVIAGQGTIAMEILRQHPQPIDAIFIPVGGGGLCAGIATYVKYLQPSTKIIAVEPEDAACLKAALRVGQPVNLSQVGLFAEGVAVARIGELPFRLLQPLVDEVITVTTDEMCAAVKDIFMDTRALAEVSGAVSLAGLKHYAQRTQRTQQQLICINSGANTNFERLQHIAERTRLGEHREAILAVKIEEHPGSLKEFCKHIGTRMITEFNYRYQHNQAAQIYVGIQVSSASDREYLLKALNQAHYSVIDLSFNELAKVHIRHLNGGRNSLLANGLLERLYHFEFPERPGALMQFLQTLPETWNISLFHYRNHGAAYGRVLIGLQIPADALKYLAQHLDASGYRYTDESENPAYQLFLA